MKTNKKGLLLVVFGILLLNCQFLFPTDFEEPVPSDPLPTAEQFSGEVPDGIPTVNEVETACEGDFDISETEAPADFEVDGNRAILSGVLGTDFPQEVNELLTDHPQVEVIVMTYVPGSEDDDANLEAALMIFDAGLATCVADGGEIDSGGVDLYLAGSIRRLGDDSYVGVHSWADNFGVEGNELPRDHPDHQLYLEYFSEIGIDADFYWYTLEAADSEDIHNMTEQERNAYEMETP